MGVCAVPLPSVKQLFFLPVSLPVPSGRRPLCRDYSEPRRKIQPVGNGTGRPFPPVFPPDTRQRLELVRQTDLDTGKRIPRGPVGIVEGTDVVIAAVDVDDAAVQPGSF